MFIIWNKQNIQWYANQLSLNYDYKNINVIIEPITNDNIKALGINSTGILITDENVSIIFRNEMFIRSMKRESDTVLIIESAKHENDIKVSVKQYNDFYSTVMASINRVAQIVNAESGFYGAEAIGIPKYWNRSDYNYEEPAILAMKDLIQKTIQKSKFILLSYNNEGIISMEKWDQIFTDYEAQIKYTKEQGLI